MIFDRYSRRGLLPLAYLDNVAQYVEEGGALLEVAGPEFAHPLSLYRTPLARVLPGRPSGVVYERGFRADLDRNRPASPGDRGLEAAWAPMPPTTTRPGAAGSARSMSRCPIRRC